jgi:hypothetical protein
MVYRSLERRTALKAIPHCPHKPNLFQVSSGIGQTGGVFDKLALSHGAYLSQEQVAELVAPHPETLDIVGAWLEHKRVRCPSSISTTLDASYQRRTARFSAPQLLTSGGSTWVHTNGSADDLLRRLYAQGGDKMVDALQPARYAGCSKR